MKHVRELSPLETAAALGDLCSTVLHDSMGVKSILEHAATLIRDQDHRLRNQSEMIREMVREKQNLQMESKLCKDKPVDPEAIRSLGFLEGIAFQIEDDVLYESMKDALEKISRVLK